MVLTQNLEPYITGEALDISDNERSKTFPETSEIVPGDIVRDLDAPECADNNLMRVKSVSNKSANEWYVNDDEELYTVADENPDYPSDMPVISCQPGEIQTSIRIHMHGWN